MTPDVSVVIPTHNRLPYLRQCLAALAAQRFPLDRLEVIVSADGCSDGTEAALAEASYPFRLDVLSQSASGAASARNRGAEAARGPLLLFLDDDVIASPGLVEAHVCVHAQEERRVVVGPYLLDKPEPGNFHAKALYLFWKQTFDTLADPEHLPTYQDVLGGNLSLAKTTFVQTGGFDPRFACVEDPEYGLRLLAAGFRFTFAVNARARHLETTDLIRSFQRARQEGYAHVQLCELHPKALSTLPVAHVDLAAQWLTLRAPKLGERAAITATALLRGSEQLQLQWLWNRLYKKIGLYWYWRGVADNVGNPEGWAAWMDRMNTGRR